MSKQEVFISNGSRPWWQQIIAAALFTASIYFAYLSLSNYSAEHVGKNYKAVASAMELAIILFGLGIGFSMVINYHFDIANKRYKKIFSFGMVQFGKWTPFQNIEYVAVYTNQREITEVNIWYDRNQHFEVTAYEDSEQALIAGTSIARQLGIDLWDARDPRNGDWVALEE